VFTGGTGTGPTTAVRVDAAVAEPTSLVAVTTTRSVNPSSAATTGYCLAVPPWMSTDDRPSGVTRRHS
jgi:hypothetical protein